MFLFGRNKKEEHPMQPILSIIKTINIGNIDNKTPINIIEQINNDQLFNIMGYIKRYLHTKQNDHDQRTDKDIFNLYLIRNGLSAIDLKELMEEMLRNRSRNNKNAIKQKTHIDDSPLTNAGMQQALYLNENIKDPKENEQQTHYNAIRNSTILTSYMRSSIETAILAMQDTSTMITPIPYTRQDKWGDQYDPNFDSINYHNNFAELNGVDFNSDLFSEELMKTIFHDRTKMRFGRTSKRPKTNTHIGRISNITDYPRMFRRHFLKVLAITLIVSVIMINDGPNNTNNTLKQKQLNFIDNFVSKTYTLFSNSQFIRRIAELTVDVHPIGIMKLSCWFNNDNELIINDSEYICMAEQYMDSETYIIRPYGKAYGYQSLNNIKQTNIEQKNGKVKLPVFFKNNINTRARSILHSNLKAYFVYIDVKPVLKHSRTGSTKKYLGNDNMFGYRYTKSVKENNVYILPLTLHTARIFREIYNKLFKNTTNIQNGSLNRLVTKLQNTNINNKMRLFAQRMLSNHLKFISNYIETGNPQNEKLNVGAEESKSNKAEIQRQRNLEEQRQRNAEAEAQRQRNAEAEAQRQRNAEAQRQRNAEAEAQRQRNAEANAIQRQNNTYQRVQRNQQKRKAKPQVNVTAELKRRQNERRQRQLEKQRQNAEELNRQQKKASERQETGVWFSGLFGRKNPVKPRSNAEAKWHKAQQNLNAVNLNRPLLSNNNNSVNNEVNLDGGKKKNKPKNKPKFKRKSKK